MTSPKDEKKLFSWKELFSFVASPFDWIQVEITSDCQAQCSYCPRTVYQNHWPDRYLSLDSFKKLQPAFAHARMVHLQGWGEPFLHPDFFAMAAIAKEAGCRVGTTTNGMLLNPNLITRLVAVPLDTIAFSLAGTDLNNDKIRRGTKLKQVLETIQMLDREKKRVNSDKPSIHIAYMVLRSRIEDLAQLPALLQDLSVSQVVISTLDFVAQPELAPETIKPAATREYKEVEQTLKTLALQGVAKGLPIHLNLPPLNRKYPKCTENIQRALCVASDGAVTPCVFTNLQIPGEEYLYQGQKKRYERMIFGNINQERLTDIWRKENYRRFRRSFATGTLASSCRSCPKMVFES
jgi:MoaA/NifB/PqqE/SkfB family radical SAM enzyme